MPSNIIQAIIDAPSENDEQYLAREREARATLIDRFCKPTTELHFDTAAENLNYAAGDKCLYLGSHRCEESPINDGAYDGYYVELWAWADGTEPSDYAMWSLHTDTDPAQYPITFCPSCGIRLYELLHAYD